MAKFCGIALKKLCAEKDPILTVAITFLKWVLIILVLSAMTDKYDLKLFNAFIIGSTVFGFCSFFEAFFNANHKNDILAAIFRSDSQEQSRLLNIGILSFLFSLLIAIVLAIFSSKIVPIFESEKIELSSFLVIIVAIIAIPISSSLSFVDSFFISSGRLYQIRAIEIFCIVLALPIIMFGDISTYNVMMVAIMSYFPITFSRLTAIIVHYVKSGWQIKLNPHSFIDYYTKHIVSSISFAMANLAAYVITALPVYQLVQKGHQNDLAAFGMTAKIFGAPMLALTYFFPFFWKFLGENLHKNDHNAIKRFSSIYILLLGIFYLISLFFCKWLFSSFFPNQYHLLSFEFSTFVIISLYYLTSALIGFFSVKLIAVSRFKEQFFAYGLVILIYISLSTFMEDLTLNSIFSYLLISSIVGFVVLSIFESRAYRIYESK